MSEACSDVTGGGPLCPNAGASRTAAWLSLAAAPTFAAMALMSAVLGDSAAATVCVHDTSPLSGMTAMYALMAAFHAAPWLKLIFRA